MTVGRRADYTAKEKTTSCRAVCRSLSREKIWETDNFDREHPSC